MSSYGMDRSDRPKAQRGPRLAQGLPEVASVTGSAILRRHALRVPRGSWRSSQARSRPKWKRTTRPRRNTGSVGSSSAQRQIVFTLTWSIAASWAGVTYSGVGDFGGVLISRIRSPMSWQQRSGLACAGGHLALADSPKHSGGPVSRSFLHRRSGKLEMEISEGEPASIVMGLRLRRSVRPSHSRRGVPRSLSSREVLR